MSHDQNRSRLDKFQKRRKNTKLMTYLMVAAGILVVFLIGLFVFSDTNAEKEREQAATSPAETAQKASQPETTQKQKAEAADEKKEDAEQDKKPAEPDDQATKDKDENKDENEIKTKSVEPSDDNVAEAFTANWKPSGTEQTGPHTTNYDEGSQDRKEMEQAIKTATGLKAMTTWWLQRGGEQKVIATVSNKKDESEVYRVYLKWIDQKGWQPTKVELLKQNDQAYRFR